MILHRLLLQNFRSYSTADFTFSDGVTFIIGPNTAGKSNIMEAIFLLSSGKSFRAERDVQLLKFSEHISHIKGKTIQDGDAEILEVILNDGVLTGNTMFSKRYMINNVPKRRIDFVGKMPALLFDPTDLDIIAGSPSLRREFLDEVLEQTDINYRTSILTYTKALRQRNALLQMTKKSGIRQEKQFAYWDELLLHNGALITSKRKDFINWMNEQSKSLFSWVLAYDASEISEERLLQYKEAEVGAGVTLVGPHRDDVLVFMDQDKNGEKIQATSVNVEGVEVKAYGSRGQQRLAVVQLKLLQLQYMQLQMKDKPLLLLDDIFSELDSIHIQHVLSVVQQQQTIITTTHKEFTEYMDIPSASFIELVQ